MQQQTNPAPDPHRDSASPLFEAATNAAFGLRAAEAKFEAIVDNLLQALPHDVFSKVSRGVEYYRTEWLSDLVRCLGDPDRVYFAVHSNLDVGSEGLVDSVREAWGELFEVETRLICRGREILLTLRPKGGREPTTDDLRPATPQDICIGQRLYILNEDNHVFEELTVAEVRDAAAKHKGFTANDGRRYGLDGTVFIVPGLRSTD